MKFVRCKRRRPIKLVIGPGIIGTKLPIRPIKHKIIPQTTNIILIKYFKITKYKSEFL